MNVNLWMRYTNGGGWPSHNTTVTGITHAMSRIKAVLGYAERSQDPS
jgi:hypothetical protein